MTKVVKNSAVIRFKQQLEGSTHVNNKRYSHDRKLEEFFQDQMTEYREICEDLRELNKQYEKLKNLYITGKLSDKEILNSYEDTKKDYELKYDNQKRIIGQLMGIQRYLFRQKKASYVINQIDINRLLNLDINKASMELAMLL